MQNNFLSNPFSGIKFSEFTEETCPYSIEPISDILRRQNKLKLPCIIALIQEKLNQKDYTFYFNPIPLLRCFSSITEFQNPTNRNTVERISLIWNVNTELLQKNDDQSEVIGVIAKETEDGKISEIREHVDAIMHDDPQIRFRSQIDFLEKSTLSGSPKSIEFWLDIIYNTMVTTQPQTLNSKVLPIILEHILNSLKETDPLYLKITTMLCYANTSILVRSTLEYCVEENPKDVLALILLARICEIKGLEELALTYFTAASKLDLTNEYIFIKIAQIHQKLQRDIEASTFYQKALEINRENEVVLDVLLRLSLTSPLIFSDKKDFIQGILKEDAICFTNHSELLIQQGLFYLQLDAKKSALAAFEKAYNLGNRNQKVLEHMGTLYCELEEHKKAHEIFTYIYKHAFTPASKILNNMLCYFIKQEDYAKAYWCALNIMHKTPCQLDLEILGNLLPNLELTERISAVRNFLDASTSKSVSQTALWKLHCFIWATSKTQVECRPEQKIAIDESVQILHKTESEEVFTNIATSLFSKLPTVAKENPIFPYIMQMYTSLLESSDLSTQRKKTLKEIMSKEQK